MIDCFRCKTGKMLVSRERGILAQCVNCGHELLDFEEAITRRKNHEWSAKHESDHMLKGGSHLYR